MNFFLAEPKSISREGTAGGTFLPLTAASLE